MSKKYKSPGTEIEITNIHAEAVNQLMLKEQLKPKNINLIGFHGHTIFHDPSNHKTCQIGDGGLLAKITGIDVVDDFRTNDVLNGGQGAPLAPLFHKVMSEKFIKPLMILNLGGVANMTWIDQNGELTAFDTGPGNALIDDFIQMRIGKRLDQNGEIASSGKPDKRILEEMLNHPFFDLKGPKSLDRNHFNMEPILCLSNSDGAATLCAFTAETVNKSISYLGDPPKLCIVTGGGRNNLSLMLELKNRLKTDVRKAEEFGWDGDFLEAQAFGYLAVRSLKGLPLSFPSTTGVDQPVSGGVYHKAKK